MYISCGVFFFLEMIVRTKVREPFTGASRIASFRARWGR